MNEEKKDNEEPVKIDNEEPVKIDKEEAIKKDKEERRKRKEERRKKKYSQMINYPNMKVEIHLATETDTDAELFNNMFEENQVICQNNVKRYVFCSTIFILYGIIGFMYYTYIY
jgi:hypothetical protein